MVVFIMPRNLASSRFAGDIQKDIEESSGFNEQCQHGDVYRELKSIVVDQVKHLKLAAPISIEYVKKCEEFQREHNKPNHGNKATREKLGNEMIEVDARLKGTMQQAKISNSKIHIHHDVKKENGQPVTLNDIHDNWTFGNGVSMIEMTLKNGEKVPVVICVFPHTRESTIISKLAQLKGICEL